MDIVERIIKTIEPSLESMGYRLVQVKLAEGSRRKALLIMAERADDVFMSFDDCTAISQTVSALLDVDDPITTAYDLEVMSPGLDRPLTKLADFVRYTGYEIKCETLIPVENRKRFKGIIKGLKGEIISLAADTGDVELGFGNLRSAKLAVTESLVADTLRKQKKEEEAREAAEKEG
ncbi:MAG: ribosome maturation factor RimP [Alphaproteobacteria bacterium]|nr:ribosome maturation factor RimP [Alphaproteobacteria bacterium]